MFIYCMLYTHLCVYVCVHLCLWESVFKHLRDSTFISSSMQIKRLHERMSVCVSDPPESITTSSTLIQHTDTVCVCVCVYCVLCVCVCQSECVSGMQGQGGGCSQRCRKGLLIRGIIACLLFSLWAFQRRLGVAGKPVTPRPWCCWDFKAVGNHRLRNST